MSVRGRTRIEKGVRIVSTNERKPAGRRGFGILGLSNDRYVHENLKNNSICEDELVLCLDCRVAFNIRNRTCPKCDGEQFWLVAKWKTPALRTEFSSGGSSPRRRVLAYRRRATSPAADVLEAAMRCSSASAE